MLRYTRAGRSLLSIGFLAALIAAAAPASAQQHPAGPAAPKPGHAAGAPKPGAVQAAAKPAHAPPAAAKPGAQKPGAAKPAPKNGGKPGAAKPGKKPEKPGKRVLPRKPGSEPGEPDEATRRVIAGTSNDKAPRESPELRGMRELGSALFPSSAPSAGAPWDASGSVLIDASAPRVQTSGLPPAAPIRANAPPPKAPGDLAWLRQLVMPDIPVRWDERVVRYLEYYKDNPHGRSMVAGWIRKSGRYGAAIRRVLREQGLPEDVLWLSLVESGFDATIHSPVGAAGLWQFMPEGARIYGLTVDRWIDERLDPERSTLAAARYLADLRQRFGGWELAFAAYNMGYGGLLASIRKYNTNDFWELSRLEAGMPLETALYVPKIVAMAIVARNRAVFGCADVDLEPAVAFDKVAIGSGVSLKTVAAASGAGVNDIEGLNPQILAGRTPPLTPGDKETSKWVVRVPPGSAAVAAKSIPQLASREAKLERYLVRWGESLDDIATARGTWRSVLQSLNDLRRDEVIRPGTVIFVPASAGSAPAPGGVASGPAARPIVVVPAQTFLYPDRRRVFYRVIAGDTARDVAAVLGVTADEICRWNTLDPSASLHEGMALQAFIPKGRALSAVFVLDEKDATILQAGSPEFIAHFEALKGRKRMEVAARDGDTFQGIAKRYGLTSGMLERINHRSRYTKVSAGDNFVVYVPNASPSFGRPPPPDRADDKPEMAVARATSDAESDDASKEKDDDLKPSSPPGAPDDAASSGEKGEATPGTGRSGSGSMPASTPLAQQR